MTTAAVRPDPPLVAASLLAGDVMSRRLVTVSPDDSLLAAWELLSRGDFRHLPVVGPDGRCLGVVDDRMLTVAWLAGSVVQARRQVREIMPPRVHCVRPYAPLGMVAEIMLAERATVVPVVDERRALLGLVTDRDVVAAVAAEIPAG
jgi:CBS-domain-containing membrane protein